MEKRHSPLGDRLAMGFASAFGHSMRGSSGVVGERVPVASWQPTHWSEVTKCWGWLLSARATTWSMDSGIMHSEGPSVSC